MKLPKPHKPNVIIIGDKLNAGDGTPAQTTDERTPAYLDRLGKPPFGGSFIAIESSGTSMPNYIPEGKIAIGITQSMDKNWEFLQTQPYILLTKGNGWLIKTINKFTDANDNDWLMLTSSNPDKKFKPIIIDQNEVLCVFKFIKFMDRKLFWAEVIICPTDDNPSDF
ncbi:MAG: hypothetical protein IPJ82_08180 [Lewinellaceae bacterium]|nr:hypothetical protein [Lewinellaceae bacterium]